MNLDRLIGDLAARDIRLWVEAGELKFSAPAGAFDAATRELVVANKPALIAFLAASAAADATAEATLLAPAPALERPPLSAAEERLWFLYRYEGPSPVYNVLTTLHGALAVDMPAHRRALDELQRRHPALRTRFADADGVAFRVVEPRVDIPAPLVDLGALPAPLADREAARLIASEEQFCFELTEAPLLRSCVVRFGPARHLLVFNIHHAITDAWSMGVLMREYLHCLQAGTRQEPLDLPLPARGYADFAYWQRQQLAEGGFAGQLQFWKDYLDGLPPLLQLPGDYPRPARKHYVGRSQRRLLPGALAERLTELARRAGATLFMALLAAFKLMLARYARVDDIAVGTAVAGRRHAELAGVVGMFTNTIVVRGRVDEALSFSALIERVRDATLQAQANQDIPFRVVVEQLASERSLSYTPLYQVSLALNNAAEREVMELAGQGEQFSDNDGIVSTAVKDDLSVQFRRLADGLELKLTCDVQLFSPQTAQRMTDQFADLLLRLADAPGRPLREIPQFGAAERARLLALGCNPGAPWPDTASLPQLFAAQAAATPAAIALQDGARHYSYRLLDRLSDVLAAQLRSRGARPLQRIGLCVSRVADMAAGMLAILKTGAAYVPLDLAYPAAALDHIIRDTGLRLVLTALPRQPWSESGDVSVLPLDLRAAAREPSMPAAAPYFGAAHPAYVIYTSGSAGKAKGVEVTQRNIVRLVQGPDYIPIASGDVFAQMSNHAFDAATLEVWGALINGGRLVHVERLVVLDPHAFGDFLRDNAVSAMFITVALFNLMADVNPRGLASVRHVGAGGDAVSPAAMRRIFEQGKPARLLNLYGPTENTTFSTWFEFETLEDCARCPIGRPVAHSSAHVVDAGGELAPAGVVGELLVGGAGVALGYVGRPDLTAERFVPDPFSSEPGQRLYRTGDWVKRDAHGVIDYLGRFDNQVKIRGFRIETDEIQDELAAHAAVREALIAVQPDAAGEKRLIAYVICDNGDADLPALRAYLRQRLPDYKQPAGYVCLDRFPLTPNGKIDRARLPAFDATPARRADAIAPRDELERRIATHWRALLGVGNVAVDDNFFDLGGHSLLAITLSVRLRDELGVDLGTRDIFEYPSLAGLAARIRSGQLAAAPQLPPLAAVGRREKSTLSFMQQRLWFIDQMEGAQATYHMPLLLEFDAQYAPQAIAAALQAVVARHEALRTRFAEVNGIPLQRIAADSPVALPLTDLSACAAAELEQRRLDVLGAEISQPFDLTQAPLLRARLLQLPHARHLLVVTVHHIVCDGWSLGLLTRELALLLSGRAAELPPLPVQYGDYAYWQKSWLDGDILTRQLDFWRERLAGAPAVLDLRCARPRPPQRRDIGRTAAAQIDAVLAARLREFGQREGASLFMTMLAGFTLLLSRHAGHGDIVVGTPIANRPRPELEALIGFFANTLVLRTQVDARSSFVELLAQVRNNCLAAYAYQDTPLDLLVDALAPQRSLAHTPLVQVIFAQENFATLDAGLPPGVTPVSLRDENRTAKFDLNLSFEDSGAGLQLYCEYSADLFDAAIVTDLLDQYRGLLHALLDAPQSPMAQISVLGAAREALARQRLNANADAAGESDGIAAVFARIAAEHPQAVALLGDGESWSYADLAAAAARVAAALRTAGLAPQRTVGIALDNSAWRIAAELGVLHCGGIVVPLDLDQGAAVIDAVAAHADLAVLLVDEASAPAPRDVATLRIGASLPAADTALAPLPLGAEALAYLLYGDDAAPARGIALPQRAVTRLVRDADWLPGGGRLRGITGSAPTSDMRLLETWAPLLNGGSLVVTTTRAVEIAAFTHLLAQHRVQWLWLPSLLLDAWAAALDTPLPDLAAVLSGGGDLSWPARAALAARLPDATLLRVHGPAENAAVSTAVVVGDGIATSTIGRSVAGCRVRVLDGDAEDVPCGVPGQLHFGGSGLAQGYWRDAAATALRFVPDAQSATPGARIWRSDESAVLDGDGTLHWLGSNQPVPRGGRFQLEPGVLEQVLRQRAELSDAVVLVHGHAAAAASLVAFVVARGGFDDLAALKADLERTLPESQRPASLIALDALPRTAAGQPDRQLLLRRLRGDARNSDTTAPVGATEQGIAAIWAGLLGVATPGRHANFFGLGGHSLLAAQACARINQRFGVDLSVKAFYASADLAALAAQVDQALQLDRALADIDIDNLSDEEAEKLLAQLQAET